MSGFGESAPTIPEGLGSGIVEHFLTQHAGRVAVLREMVVDEPDRLFPTDWELLAQADAVEEFQGGLNA